MCLKDAALRENHLPRRHGKCFVAQRALHCLMGLGTWRAIRRVAAGNGSTPASGSTQLIYKDAEKEVNS